MIDETTFRRAVSRVISEQCTDTGIGTLTEKVIHKVMKLSFEPDETFHEVKFMGKVADIMNSRGITEIQTKSFSYLTPKLRKFLTEVPVTLVYPVVAQKSIRWLDKESGEISPPRRSPRRKTLYDTSRELYSIRDFLPHENLTVKLIFLECEEYKRLDGWDKTGKKNATPLECIPKRIIEEITLKEKEDYRIFIPETLGDEFVIDDFYKAAHSRSRYSYYSVRLAMHLGFVEHTHNRGRAYVYTRKKADP